jgi:hypothetical protein
LDISYIVLSGSVVLAVMGRISPDTALIANPTPFAECFKAEGLTEDDLAAAMQDLAEPRVWRCLYRFM